MKPMSEERDEEVDRARRRLIKAVAYAAPVVMSTVVVKPALAQQAISCGPNSCNPAGGLCGPSGCMPNNPPCNPAGCNPNTP